MKKSKYLGVIISEEGGSEEAVRARVSTGWAKWRDLSEVISDKKKPRKLKVKLYMMPLDQYFCMVQNVGQLERRKNRFSKIQR